MRMLTRVALVAAVPAAVVMIGVAVHAKPADEISHRPSAVQVVPATSSPSGGSAAAPKSHTVARSLAGHALYHLVPHVPYMFRPRVFRGGLLFRRRY